MEKSLEQLAQATSFTEDTPPKVVLHASSGPLDIPVSPITALPSPLSPSPSSSQTPASVSSSSLSLLSPMGRLTVGGPLPANEQPTGDQQTVRRSACYALQPELASPQFAPIQPSSSSTQSQLAMEHDWEVEKKETLRAWTAAGQRLEKSNSQASTSSFQRQDASSTNSKSGTRPPPSASNQAKKKEKVLEARDKHLEDHMPRVQKASHRLQSALEIFNGDPWPLPPTRPLPDIALQRKANEIRGALILCGDYAVEMNRKSENQDFVDRSILAMFYSKTEIGAQPEEIDTSKERVEDQQMTGGIDSTPDHHSTMHSRDQQIIHGVDETPDTVMTDIDQVSEASFGDDTTPKNDTSQKSILNDMKPEKPQPGVHEVSIEDSATPKHTIMKAVFDAVPRNTMPKNSGTASGQALPVPDPTKMRGTFTHAICHQKKLTAEPILTLTLMDSSRVTSNPNEPQCTLLRHFEVGLDGVESLCRGFVTIEENSWWKKNVREKRLGRLGTVKAGAGGYSKELEKEQLKKGMGQGRWEFFGIKLQQSGKERKKGKGGKWACFGVPVEAIRPGADQMALVGFGGGTDINGNFVPKQQRQALRETAKFSAGGIACMDLWEGGEQWEKGIWQGARDAMAYNSLVVSFLS